MNDREPRPEPELHESAALYDARMRFEEVFEHAPIGMALTAMEGRLFRVNPAACVMLGRPADEIVGRTFSEITHPDDRSARRATTCSPAWRHTSCSSRRCNASYSRHSGGRRRWPCCSSTSITSSR